MGEREIGHADGNGRRGEARQAETAPAWKAAATKAQRATRFVEELARTGSVVAACRFAGISRATAFRWRAKSERFARRWRHARRDAAEELELEARRRAVAGSVETITERDRAGEVFRTVERHKRSDAMLSKLLTGALPRKYDRRASDPPRVNVQIIVPPATQARVAQDPRILELAADLDAALAAPNGPGLKLPAPDNDGD